MPATFNDGLVKGRNAGGPITKKRFVTDDTSASDGETVIQAGANDDTPPKGVSKFSVSTAEIAQGKGCSVVVDGRAIVTVGAADLAQGDPVTSDVDGKAVVATDGDWFCGSVDEAGTAGNDCTIIQASPGNKYYAG